MIPPSSSCSKQGDSRVIDSKDGVRSDLYEERTTPSSGIGAFATSFIPSGTRIFCESPLILLPDDAGHVDLYKLVTWLPESKQADFWSLAASKPNKEVSHIESLRKSYAGNFPFIEIEMKRCLLGMAYDKTYTHPRTLMHLSKNMN